MDLINSLKALLVLDIQSLMGVLVWGDLALALLTFGYYRYHITNEEKSQINKFGLAKLIQAIAWLLLFLRGGISEFISIYLANLILYFSFYLESLSMLNMVDDVKPKWFKVQKIILVLTMIIFVTYTSSVGDSNVRVAIASISVFSLLVCPTFIYIFNKDSSKFKRYLGSFVLLFIILLLSRAFQALVNNEINLFTNNVIQSGTFIILILLMFINGAGFLLLMYENADRYLKSIADFDPLTRIHNRRYFMMKASAYFERHRLSGQPLAILFIDIDHFKVVNDTYGHLFGDQLLKNLAIIIGESIRPTDLCCRYGGEEFVILLNESNKKHAVLVGDRIRQRIGNSVFDRNENYQYTISIGVYSAIPDAYECLENFIENSDHAMYEAKEAGRDQVIVYDEKRL